MSRFTIIAALMLLGLTIVTPYSVFAGSRISRHKLPRDPQSVAFAFNTGGPVMVDGTIQILADGTQRHVGRMGCLVNPHRIIPRTSLVRLLQLADSVRFFSLPAFIKSNVPNVDMSGKMVSIHTSSGVKTVREGYGGYNARFDRMYSALRKAAPFTFTCATRVSSR